MMLKTFFLLAAVVLLAAAEPLPLEPEGLEEKKDLVEPSEELPGAKGPGDASDLQADSTFGFGWYAPRYSSWGYRPRYYGGGWGGYGGGGWGGYNNGWGRGYGGGWNRGWGGYGWGGRRYGGYW